VIEHALVDCFWTEVMDMETKTDVSIAEAIEALDRRVDTGLADVAGVMQTMAQRHMDERIEQERRNAGFTTRSDVGEAISVTERPGGANRGSGGRHS